MPIDASCPVLGGPIDTRNCVGCVDMPTCNAYVIQLGEDCVVACEAYLDALRARYELAILLTGAEVE